MTRNSGREQQRKVNQREGAIREGNLLPETKFFALDKTLFLVLPAKVLPEYQQGSETTVFWEGGKF